MKFFILLLCSITLISCSESDDETPVTTSTATASAVSTSSASATASVAPTSSVSSLPGSPVIIPISVPAPESLPGSGNWRSALYPDSWTPGFSSGGNFLHDFSYAGYRKGEYLIPVTSNGSTIDVTQSPYNADKTGTVDSTAAIQKALDDVGVSGGGIVYLPAGTYKIGHGTTSDNAIVLRISYSNVILRGAGTANTFILNTSNYMRNGSVIRIQPSTGSTNANFWDTYKTNSTTISAEYAMPTQSIQVSSTSGFNVGDWIVIAERNNAAMIADMGMGTARGTSGQTPWTVENPKGPRFLRKITAISGNTISFDIPTRFAILAKYEPSVYKLSTLPLEDIGVENFSIGNIQSTKTGNGEEDYNTAGTMAYEVHGSHVIDFRYVVNSWAKNISTYKPSANTDDFHVLSNCMRFLQTRGVTAIECVLQKPQYEGGGGNGYMFTLEGNDNLITNCQAVHGRHNYDFKYMYSNGNVITKSKSTTPKLVSDFHMYLSMANLFDAMTLDNDCIESVYRPYGTIEHGQVSTETAIWNTTAIGTKTYAVSSQQWGKGYVIGTQGTVTTIKLPSDISGLSTAPVDFTEGQALALTLFPQSLYESQYNRRRNREPYSVTSYPRIVTATAYQMGNEPERLIDGNTDDLSRWSCQTYPQSTVIDYGSVKTIKGIKVYTYLSRAYQYKVELSSSPDSGFTTIVDRTANTSTSQPITDTCTPATGRYLKLTVTGASVYTGTWISINELQIVE